MQTGLADRNGMHCRKTRTEINADKCRNLQPKALHSSPPGMPINTGDSEEKVKSEEYFFVSFA